MANSDSPLVPLLFSYVEQGMALSKWRMIPKGNDRILAMISSFPVEAIDEFLLLGVDPEMLMSHTMNETMYLRMLEHGVSLPWSAENNELLFAVNHKHLNLAMALYRRGYSLELGEAVVPLLQQAVEAKRIDYVEELLQLGVYASESSLTNGHNALHSAMRLLSQDPVEDSNSVAARMVQLLLHHDARIITDPHTFLDYLKKPVLWPVFAQWLVDAHRANSNSQLSEVQEYFRYRFSFTFAENERTAAAQQVIKILSTASGEMEAG